MYRLRSYLGWRRKYRSRKRSDGYSLTVLSLQAPNVDSHGGPLSSVASLAPPVTGSGRLASNYRPCVV